MYRSNPARRCIAVVTTALVLFAVAGCATVDSSAVLDSLKPTTIKPVNREEYTQRVKQQWQAEGLRLRTYLENGEYEVAMRYLDTLYNRAGENHTAETTFLRELSSVADGAEALDGLSISDFIIKYQRSTPVMFLNGMHYHNKALQARAKKSAEKITEQQSASMTRHLRTAAVNFNNVLREDPESYLAHAKLAAIHSQYAAQKPRAESAFKKALEIKPDSYAVWDSYLWLSRPRWIGTYENMGKMLVNMRPHEASNPELASLQGMVLADKADVAISQQQYAEAQRLLNRALQFGPNAYYYNLLGAAARKSGNARVACNYRKQALEQAPTSRFYLKLLMECE